MSPATPPPPEPLSAAARTTSVSPMASATSKGPMDQGCQEAVARIRIGRGLAQLLSRVVCSATIYPRKENTDIEKRAIVHNPGLGLSTPSATNIAAGASRKSTSSLSSAKPIVPFTSNPAKS